jgi:hypothetical protein
VLVPGSQKSIGALALDYGNYEDHAIFLCAGKRFFIILGALGKVLVVSNPLQS